MANNGSLAPNAPAIRFCHILKWEDFDGYGFNLHAEKGKPGQFIGKVDDGSPAEAAGLKLGDRIIEVNGVNISNENHKQVVQRIKAMTNETHLLVVDAEADKYYKSKSIIIKGTLPSVITLKSPEQKPTDSDSSHELNDTKIYTSNIGTPPKAEDVKQHSPNKGMNGERNSSDTSPARSSDTIVEGSQQMKINDDAETSSATSETSQPSSPSSGLNLNMTAAQLRAQLAARKKYDPKKENIDVRKKFDIIQTL